MSRRTTGFTLIEVLIVILILAVLMAVALPLYLRAVRDAERQTCRSNMQTIAHAEQAYRIRSNGHIYASDLTLLVGLTEDMQTIPRCPSDRTPDTYDYRVEISEGDLITIYCDCDDAGIATFHNLSGGANPSGYTPGEDAE